MISLVEASDRLAAALIEGNDDASEAAGNDVEGCIDASDEAQLSAAVAAVASRLADVSLSDGHDAVLFAAALVERGGSPAPLVRVIEPRIIAGLMLAADFPNMWELASYGAGLPEPDDEDVIIEDVLDQMMRNLLRAQATEDEARSVAEAWFEIGTWLLALLAALEPEAGRRALTSQTELADALEPLAEHFETASWLIGLFRVLDDEPLIVLHRESGRGYRLTIGGIADNFQLETLIEDRIVGDAGSGLVYGVRPDRAWVAAATDGEADPEKSVRSLFTLTGADGEPIWGEDTPADIPLLDGVRVVVLDPQSVPRTWTAGRVYEGMRPTVRLDHVMPSAEAVDWLARVQPTVSE